MKNTKKQFGSGYEVKLAHKLHQAWVASNGQFGERLDLTGWTVDHRSFRGMDLNQVVLAGATVTNTVFVDASLIGADLTGATFTDCDFNRCAGVAVKQEVTFEAPAVDAPAATDAPATEATKRK